MNNIYDTDGEQISLTTCDASFIKPFIIVDRLRDRELKPEIEPFSNIRKLKEIEFVLYSKNLTKKKTWIRNQKFFLSIKPEEEPLEKGFKKINKLPANHFFEIDTANHKIRIVGAYSHPSGYGDWIYY